MIDIVSIGFNDFMKAIRGNPYKHQEGKKVRVSFGYFDKNGMGETVEGILNCNGYLNTIFVGDHSIGVAMVKEVRVVE